MTKQVKHITVCICTYKRPVLLKKLLSKLEQQETAGLFEYSVVVVDNDVAESARQTVESFAEQSNLSIAYYVEPVQNIARARNKAVENARGTYIAFIDDDEFPVNNWLCGLYETTIRFKSDGTLGPVMPSFQSKPPQWIVKGKFCERPNYETGTQIHWSSSRTGNVLLNKGIFDDLLHPFNPDFGVQGEDVQFFREMHRRGHIFVWCREAIVYEVIPFERFKKSYFFRRAFVQGSTSLKYQVPLTLMQKTYVLSKSLTACTIYSFLLPFSLFFGFWLAMKLLIKGIHHFSRLLTLLKLVTVKARNY